MLYSLVVQKLFDLIVQKKIQKRECSRERNKKGIEERERNLMEESEETQELLDVTPSTEKIRRRLR